MRLTVREGQRGVRDVIAGPMHFAQRADAVRLAGTTFVSAVVHEHQIEIVSGLTLTHAGPALKGGLHGCIQ